jgi:O-antigen/teichoic acid export membrane protein
MTSFFRKIIAFFVRFKDLTALGVSNLLVSAIGGVFWIVLATLMDVEAYGEIGYYLSIATIVGVSATLGASNTITVYTAKGEKLQKSFLYLVGTSGIISSIIIFLLLQNLGVSIFVLGYVIFNLVISETLGKKLYIKYAKIIITQRVLMVGLAIALFFGMGVDGVIIGIGLSFIPFSVIIYKNFNESKFSWLQLKEKKKFIANSFTLDISKVFSCQIDKLMIAPIFGFAILGNYYLGIQIFNLLVLLPAAVYYYTLPQDASGKSNPKLKKVVYAGSGILALLGIFLAPVLIPYLFPKFLDVIVVIQILSIAIFPRTVTFMYNSEFIGNEKVRTVVIGSLIFIAVQIPLIFIFGDLYGIVGIATSLVLATVAETGYLVVIKRIRF